MKIYIKCIAPSLDYEQNQKATYNIIVALTWVTKNEVTFVGGISKRRLYKHALEHLEVAGPEKKGSFFCSYSKCLSIFDLFEGL